MLHLLLICHGDARPGDMAKSRRVILFSVIVKVPAEYEAEEDG